MQPRFAMLVLVDRHVKNMIKDDSIRNIRVFKWPFKHALMHNFFSQDVYASMLERLPNYSKYTEEQNRYEFWLNEQNTMCLSPEDREFWNTVHASIVNKGSDLLDAFGGHLNIDREDSEPLSDQYQVWVRLVREYCPFILLPHLDMQIKSFVIVVYLTADEQFRQYGTVLYKKMGPHFLPLKKLPYVPNLATIIPRTENAWHGGQWNKRFIRNTLHIYFTHYSEWELRRRNFSRNGTHPFSRAYTPPPQEQAG